MTIYDFVLLAVWKLHWYLWVCEHIRTVCGCTISLPEDETP